MPIPLVPGDPSGPGSPRSPENKSTMKYKNMYTCYKK